MAISQDQVDVIIRTFGLEQLDAISQSFIKISIESQKAGRKIFQTMSQGLNEAVSALGGAKELFPSLDKEGELLEGTTSRMATALQRLQGELEDLAIGARPITQNILPKLIVQTDAYGEAAERAGGRARELGASFNQLRTQMGEALTSISKSAKEMEESGLSGSFDQIGKSAEKTNSYMSGFEDRTEGAAKALNILSAGAAGFLAATSAVQGNVVGMAFGLIFLKFAMVPIATAAAVLTISIGSLITSITKAVSAFKTFQDSLFGFTQQLGDFNAGMGAMEVSQQIAEKFGFGLDTVTKGMDRLIKAGIPGLKGLLPVIQDLAATMEGDFTRAAETVSNAIGFETGNLLALRDAGIVVDRKMAESFNKMDRQSRALAVQALILEKYGGAASEFRKTLTGAFTAVKVAATGFFTAIGGPIVNQVLVPLLNKLADFAISLRKAAQAFVETEEFLRPWNKLLFESKELLKNLGFFSEDAGEKFRRYFLTSVIRTIQMLTLFIIIARRTVLVIKQIAAALKFTLPFWKAMADGIRIVISFIKELGDLLRGLKGTTLDIGVVLGAMLRGLGLGFVQEITAFFRSFRIPTIRIPNLRLAVRVINIRAANLRTRIRKLFGDFRVPRLRIRVPRLSVEVNRIGIRAVGLRNRIRALFRVQLRDSLGRFTANYAWRLPRPRIILPRGLSALLRRVFGDWLTLGLRNTFRTILATPQLARLIDDPFLEIGNMIIRAALKLPGFLARSAVFAIKLPLRILTAPLKIVEVLKALGKFSDGLAKGFTTLMRDVGAKGFRGFARGVLRGLIRGLGALVALVIGTILIQFLPIGDKLKEFVTQMFIEGFTGGMLGASFGIPGIIAGTLIGIIVGAIEAATGIDVIDVLIDKFSGMLDLSWKDALKFFGIAAAAIATVIILSFFSLPAGAIFAGVIAALLLGSLAVGLIEKYEGVLREFGTKILGVALGLLPSTGGSVIGLFIAAFLLGVLAVSLIGKFKEQISAAWGVMKGVAVDAFDAVAGFITDNWKAIITGIIIGAFGFGSLGIVISQALAFFGGHVKNVVVGNIRSILGSITDVGMEIVTSLIDGVLGLDVFNAGLDLGSNLIRGIATGVKDKWESVKGGILDIIDPRNWDIPGLSKLAEAYGHAGLIAGGLLIQGITTGIDEEAAKAAGDVADAALTIIEALNTVLGIKSGAFDDLPNSADIELLAEFVTRLMISLKEIQDMVPEKKAKEFAEKMAEIFGSLSDAMGSLNDLQEPLASLDLIQLENTTDDLIKAAVKIAYTIDEWTGHGSLPPISDLALEFSERAADVLRFIGEGVASLVPLQDFAAPTRSAIQTFADAIVDVVEIMDETATRLGGGAANSVLSRAGDFASSADSVFSLIGDAAGSIKDLRSIGEEEILIDFEGFKAAIVAAIQAFADLDVIVTQDMITKAQAFADSSDELFDDIEQAAQAISSVKDQGKDIKEAFEDLHTKMREGAFFLAAAANLVTGGTIGSHWTRLINGLAAALSTTGLSLGDDLANGILVGAINWVNGGAANGLARQLVRAIKRILENAAGAGSPAREFMSLGQQIALGIAAGIDQGKDEIMKSFVEATEFTPAFMSALTSQAVLAGSNRVPVVARNGGSVSSGTTTFIFQITDSVITNQAAMDELANTISKRIGQNISSQVLFDVR